MAKPKKKPVDVVAPTVERIAGRETHRVGLATRLTPPIDTLLKRERISHAEHKALGHYADQKALAEASPLKDSIGRLISPQGGDGWGCLPPSVISAQREVRWLEGELGSLRPIAEAIAVEEMTMTEWICRNGGGRLKCWKEQGQKVCKYHASKEEMDMAILELRFAARRLISAMQA